MDSVYQRLGKPDNGDAAMGSSMSTWYTHHQATGYQTSIFAGRNMGSADETTGRVKQIMITSPYFKTAQGLHTGLTYRQIAAVYHLKEVAVTGKSKQLTLYRAPGGISFEFGTDSLCKSIIVLPANAANGNTYLNYYPSL